MTILFRKAAFLAVASTLLVLGCGQPQDASQTSSIQAAKEAASAFVALKKAAERGDAKAQLDLARRYDEGNGVEKNLAAAFGWFMKSAENGNAEAMYVVGKFYQDGHGVPKDMDKSNSWIKKAAEAGYADAQFKLARTFGFTGRATWIFSAKGKEQQDYARQYVEWLEKAAKQNYSEAKYALGMTYLLGAYANWWEGTGKKIIESDIDKGVWDHIFSVQTHTK